MTGPKEVVVNNNRTGDKVDYDQHRMYAALDSINDELGKIRASLIEVAEVKVYIKSYGETLSRYGSRIERMEVTNSELHSDNIRVSGSMRLLETKVSVLESSLSTALEKLNDTSDSHIRLEGQRDFGKELLKVFGALCVSFIIYLISQGG